MVRLQVFVVGVNWSFLFPSGRSRSEADRMDSIFLIQDAILPLYTVVVVHDLLQLLLVGLNRLFPRVEVQ